MEAGFFIVRIILSFIVGSIGSSRKIGFGWAFAASFFISPLIGLIIALCSKKPEREILFDEVEKEENV